MSIDMRRLIPSPLPALPETLMVKAGYIRHCVEAGRTCYHRRLNDPAFPRFHALVAVQERGMEIDLHFDALDSITHKGNHGQPWAYEGGRVDEEMRRILQAINERPPVGQINHPQHTTFSTKFPEDVKRSIFEILFRFK